MKHEPQARVEVQADANRVIEKDGVLIAASLSKLCELICAHDAGMHLSLCLSIHMSVYTHAHAHACSASGRESSHSERRRVDHRLA